MKLLTTLLIVTLALPSAAQEIAGTILDEKKEPLISAAVQVYQGNMLRASVVTAAHGKYYAKPIEPGYYNILVTYPGYDSTMVTGVIVVAGQRTTVNFNTRPRDPNVSSTIKIVAYKKPVVDTDKPSMDLCPDGLFPTNSIVRDSIKMTPVPPYKSDNHKRKRK